MNNLETSVVICGAGPVGLTLAHLLGEQNIDVIVIEKSENTVTEPRAIAIDGESLRTLQRVNLLEGFKDELLEGLTVEYVNGEGVKLFEVGSPELRPYGYSTVNSFDQPKLDRYLADELYQRDTVRLLFNTTLERFEQAQDGVRVRCTDADNQSLEITADYLIGCDGGRSTVRSLLGIEMQGESNPQPWLVIDTVDPYLENELECRFFCDPARPGMTIRKKHGERRWEWMLMPGEDREQLLLDENIRDIISPYTDVERVKIYRKRVYDFHAILAEHWQDGRIFLAGDAAHMTPPFAGQGLNSGFRDVANLSWKLSAVVKGHATPTILDSYEVERKDHARELIETALNLGNQIQPIDVKKATERDAQFAELNKDPGAMKALEDEMSKAILMRSVANGLVIDARQGNTSGRLLIQPKVISNFGEMVLLDECLGSNFAIIGYNCDPLEVLDEGTRTQWTNIGASIVPVSSAGCCPNGQWVVDSTRELGSSFETEEPRIVLIRPDKFCMVVACLENAIEELRAAYLLISPLSSNTKTAISSAAQC